MGEWTQTNVRCFSGYKANERPLAFLYRGGEILVQKVVESWYEPDRLCFKVMAEDGHTYRLEHHERDNSWQVKKVYKRL